MTYKQTEIYSKFEKFTDWMCIDIKRTMLCARANFLVAMGLFNYTEILGSFVIGEYQKDQTGNIKYSRKGDPLKTTPTERFNSFLRYMGTEYEKLLNRNLRIYDELRCGLTHEYLVKKKTFCIYNPDNPIDESAMERTIDPITKNIAKCGIIHHKGSWHMLNSKYYVDFKRAITKLQNQMKEGRDKVLLRNFFERAKFVNIKHFS
jgi:hypothetical protein